MVAAVELTIARIQTPRSQPSRNHDNVDQFNVKAAKTLYVTPNASRTVNRKLRGIHIFVCPPTREVVASFEAM